MASTYTPNINLEEPARGDYVGTWDTPVNANTTVIDLVTGGVANIALNNTPVVLSAAQFQCKTLIFSSTLTGNVTVTFPSSFQKSYEIRNICTGSSAFVVTLQTTGAGVNAICAPPGENADIFVYGGSMFFRNLGQIGSYLDIVGSSVPAWISGCTVPPFLNCDGTAFSSATYPQLVVRLGGTTLPDARGRNRFTLNQGTGRLTTAGAGIDGNTGLAAGGSNGITLGSSQIPSLAASGNNLISVTGPATGNLMSRTISGVSNENYASGSNGFFNTNNVTFTTNNNISVAYTNSSQAVVGSPTPGYVGGLTLIRAG